MRKLIYPLIAILFLAACRSDAELATLTAIAPVSTPVATEQVSTPTDVPLTSETPAREVATWTPEPSTWDTSCLPPGVTPMNPNPCLSQSPSGLPYMTSVIVEPNGNWGDDLTEVVYRDGKFTIDLPGFAGFAGIYLDGLELISGRCYAFNFQGAIDLRDVPAAEAVSNFSAIVRIYKDDGSIVELHPHGMTVWDDEIQDYRYSGQRDFFWGIYSNDPHPTIGIAVGINSVWATARPGNNFTIDAVIFRPTSNAGLCAGVSGF